MLYGNILYHFKGGYLTLVSDNHYIRKISFGKQELGEGVILAPEHPLLKNATTQLTEYFNGQRLQFDLSICPGGTDFQKSVWNGLLQIPYGQTWTYGQMAAYIDKPKSCRAVGGACHNNPIAIVIPCHRVIGVNGNLTGFGGGMSMKRWLLDLEQSNAAHMQNYR